MSSFSAGYVLKLASMKNQYTKCAAKAGQLLSTLPCCDVVGERHRDHHVQIVEHLLKASLHAFKLTGACYPKTVRILLATGTLDKVFKNAQTLLFRVRDCKFDV